MNKVRFMAELERLLRGLPADEREDALNYYREYIEDAGFSEIDDVTDKLGTPKQVARSILGEAVDKQVKVQKEKTNVKNSASVMWRIILCICMAPIAIPLVIIAVILFVVFTVVIFAIDIAMICTGVAVALAGCVCTIALFWSLTTPQLLMVVGIILIFVPLGILWCMGFYKLGGLATRMIAAMAKKIFVREDR